MTNLPKNLKKALLQRNRTLRATNDLLSLNPTTWRNISRTEFNDLPLKCRSTYDYSDFVCQSILFLKRSNQINHYLIFFNFEAICRYPHLFFALSFSVSFFFLSFFESVYLIHPYSITRYYVYPCIAFLIQERTRTKRKYYFLLLSITAYLNFKKIYWYEFNGSTSYARNA